MHDIAIGAFAPALREWVGSSKAMALRILPSPPPGYLSPVAMRARVGWGYPVLPLHGATCLLGILSMSSLNFMKDISACNARKKDNMTRGASVHMRACIYERIYMLIFSLEFPTSEMGFPQHPRGSLSQHPTQWVGIWAWRILVEARA